MRGNFGAAVSFNERGDFCCSYKKTSILDKELGCDGAMALSLSPHSSAFSVAVMDEKS